MANNALKRGVIRYTKSSGQNNFEVTGTLTVTGAQTFTGATTLSSTLTVTGAATFTAGAQSSAVARTATADGLTTGIIAAGTRFVSVTSANADHIIRLPSPVVGNQLDMWVGANGFELRSTVGSTINGVAGGDTNEAAIPATTLVHAFCVATDTWIVNIMDEAGADIAALVPDAV